MYLIDLVVLGLKDPKYLHSIDYCMNNYYTQMTKTKKRMETTIIGRIFTTPLDKSLMVFFFILVTTRHHLCFKFTHLIPKWLPP